ncbi:hypothetical protein V4Y02_23825, partial [Escherichia coli]
GLRRLPADSVAVYIFSCKRKIEEWSFSAAETEYLRSVTYNAHTIYLAHSSGHWEVQEHGTSIWEGLPYCLIPWRKAEGQGEYGK